MVGCIEVVHRFGHPVAGAKRITSLPNHVYHQKSFFFTGNSSQNRYNSQAV